MSTLDYFNFILNRVNFNNINIQFLVICIALKAKLFNKMSCKHCKTNCNNEFCCLGCETAYNLINRLGLIQFYEYSKNIYFKDPTKVEKMTSQINFDKFIEYNEEQNRSNVNLIVEGIHCGSCVWLIESTLRKQPNVESARLNISTKRLFISWKGDKKQLDQFVNLLLGLGYKLAPYVPDIAEIQSQEKSKDLLKRLIIAGLASVSMMMILWGVWAGRADGSMDKYTMYLMNIVSLIIALPATIYSGMTFFKSAITALKAKRSNMDVPISIAVVGALAISIQETIRAGEHVYFDAAISLVFFLLIGRYLDHKSREKARERARNLVLSQPSSVTILKENNSFEVTEIENAKIGDVALVSVGEKIPADGVIIDGETEIDNSIITGEFLPIKANEGTEVVAGAINLNAPIKIKITKLGEDTTLAQIIRLMENAEQNKSKFVELSDKVASMYTPIVLGISSLTFIGWMIYGKSIADSLLVAISVLIITCPCALGLAVPIVQVVAISRLISKGIIVKSKNALEKLTEVTDVIFDKTGTLTNPNMVPVNLEMLSEFEKEIVGSLSKHSSHVLAKALANIGGNYEFSEIEEIKGKGLKGIYNGKTVLLGNKLHVGEGELENVNAPHAWLKIGDLPAKSISFKEQLKHDAIEVVKTLQKNGMNTEIISGDYEGSVSKIAKLLNITRFKFQCSPQNKFEYVNQLMKKNLKVMMVGDGLNDSAALAAAHVSISPANAVQISQAASDVVIQGEGLLPIIELLVVANKAKVLVKQNIFLSLFYNVFAIPAAMLGYASPIAAAIVMSLSSIIVVMNSLRLR